MNVGVAYISHLHAGMQQAQSLPPLAFSPQSWPQPNPFHNRGFPDQQNFVGRAALLQDTKTALDAGKDVALTQPVAMHGAGGIGKTRAAVEFVRAHGSSYTLRLFLDAQSPDSLRASLADTATKLRLTDDPKATTEDLVLLALRLLRAVPSALVVADNADTPEALEAVRTLCHQPGGVRWLITTRLTDLGDEFAPQRVDVLSEAEATKLLQKRARKNHHNPGGDVVARAVAIELGCLPLALQQAAAYVARHRLAWPQYSTLLATNPAEALSHDAVEMKDLPESILRTYSISIARLTPNARLLLEIASLLAPAPIPEVIFLHADDEAIRRSALVELADLSLLEWQAPYLEVHRAIAIAVRLGLSGEDNRRKLLELGCYIVQDCAPQDTQHPDNWPAWTALRPHIEHLLAEESTAVAYRWLAGSLPMHLFAMGEYAAAERFYRIAIECCQRSVGAEHHETWTCRGNLAIVLNELGKHDEAEQEHRAVLNVKMRLLGMEHPETLAARNNLANALGIQGKYAEAEQEHWEVWQIYERMMGAENPDTLMSRMNWANAMASQGKHAKALQENKDVLEMRVRILGEGHPATLMSRRSVANLLAIQGEHTDAEQEIRALLKLMVRVLGTKHPDYLMSQMNLANVLHAQGKHVEAERECRTMLKIMERVMGVEHPAVLSGRMNLANVLNAQGKFSEAEQEHRAVLKLMERVLGADHPDALSNRMNLANALYAQGRYAEAEQEHRAALLLRMQVLGEEHPDSLKSRMNLAVVLSAQGRHAEAEHLYRAVMPILERVQGLDHPDVARSCYNLALCLNAQQKLLEAFSFSQQAEQIWNKVFGADHKDAKDANAFRQRIEAALNQPPPQQ